MPRPKGVQTRQLREDERQRCRTLYYDALFSISEISRITSFSADQIKTAVRTKDAKPAPRSGRPPVLDGKLLYALELFVTASKVHRFITYLKVSISFMDGMYGLYTIRSSLRRLGFRRRFARKKPPINEDIRMLRLEWAELYANWTMEQWEQILWTDETWVNDVTHRQQYCTRRVGEEYYPDCVDDKPKRKQGWMFWGSFSGATGKGPGIFWEKD
ncbi:hypothetical protein DL768_005997 [Monosporascus sp. mg162]|nr:hypothetical protein DL768_005997 [Monosporascus sp. mg162]